MKVIVFHGKHETTSYRADTPERRRAAMWMELQEREGWYGRDDEPTIPEADREIVLMPEDEFLALPEAVQKSLGVKRRMYANAVKRTAENNDFADIIDSLVHLPVEEAIEQMTVDSYGSAVHSLDYVLDLTRDREYERWSMETLVDPLP